jgi:alkylhydroperoxidase family enzyme
MLTSWCWVRGFGLAVVAIIGAVGFAHAGLAEPRISPVPASQWNDKQRSIVEQFARGGTPTNLVATYLNYPELASALLPFERYVTDESTLPARDRALLALRTAWIAKSEYMWAHAVATARKANLEKGEIERAARGPDARGWSAFDKALLAAADELYVDSFISDSTWLALSGSYQTDQMIDLPFTVGAFILMAGTANSIGVEIEPQFHDRFPRGASHRPAAQRVNQRLIGKPPRIAPLPRDQWSPEMRELLDPKNSGRSVANVYPTYAQSLRMDIARRPVGEHIRGATTLTDRQREILIIRVGVLCRAEYEWAAHYRIGRQIGLDEADISRIVAGPKQGGSNAAENLLMRAADELYNDAAVSNATWRELAAQFDTRQLLDILVTVGGYRMFSMAMNSYGVQLDPNPTRFPTELR